MTSFRSFKLEGPKGHHFQAIQTDCAVSVAYNPSLHQSAQPVAIGYAALWDTGASKTVISKRVANDLKLTPVGKAKTFHANGESIVDVYYVNLMLPNNIGYQFLQVTQGILTGFDILIGMDIIGMGEFSLTHQDGKPVFEFKLPFDKKEDSPGINGSEQKTLPEVSFKDVHRNDPCPCKSGKKYKQCHGLGTYLNNVE